MANRSRRVVYGYEEESEGVVQMLASYTKNPIVLGTMALVAFLAVTADAGMFFGMIYGEKDTRFNGRLPHSLLTLDYPYTLLRGVVVEQPVEDSDIPFFWTPHRKDAVLVGEVLKNCYGIEAIELADLEAVKNAKAVGLASRKGAKFAITSPYLREMAEIFTPENLGRTTCMFRHPLDYDLHEELLATTYDKDDNWMVGFLLNDGTSELGFKELGEAKQIARDICVSVTADKLVESLRRTADYYGWVLEGPSNCVENTVTDDDTNERILDHETDEWIQFYEKSRFDCQLYELAQQTWRAQIQTIIPLSLHLKRAKRFHADKVEEEDGQ